MKVGDKVYLESTGNNARYGNKELRESEIVKVGRKYFEVKWGFGTIKFCLEDKRQATNYGADWKIYFSKQEYQDEKEFVDSLNFIRDKLGGYSRPKLTLEQLRAIRTIIEQ